MFRGLAYFTVLDFQAAIADLDKAAELAPDNSLFNTIIYPSRGIARSQLGDHQGAIADCNKVTEDKSLGDLSANSLNSFCKAYAYQNQGDYSQAIVNANMAIENQLIAYSGYSIRALTYIGLGDFDKALAEYDNMFAYSDIDKGYTAYHVRAIAYAYLGDFQKALIDADRIVELQPQNPLGYFSRGFCRFLAQDYQGAIADATKAIEIQPKYAEAYALRGVIRTKGGDWQGGLIDLDRSLDKRNTSIVAISTKGAILYEMGNTEEAIKLWQQATEINQDPVYQLALSVALYSKGERDRALEIAKRAIASNQNLRNFESFKHLFWGDRLLADTQKLLGNIESE
jgi:tetratricopeptide (TPR) repeat protein